MNDGGANQVRARREARGWSQGALAAAAGLTRQSVNAIENGRAVPAVDVALRLARALEARVEELFAAPEPPPIVAEAPGVAAGRRVVLAHLGGRWVAHAADVGLRTAADGVVRRRGAGGAAIELWRDEARDNLLVMGCATALGLLADRCNTRAGAGRVVWLSRSSTESLGALAAGRAHVAGAHLVDGRSGRPDLAAMRRLAKQDAARVVTLAGWEAGLVARVDDQRVRGADDLERVDLRIVGREAGAGAQHLLERTLRRVGRDARAAIAMRAPGHVEVAAAVAMGAADVGVATRDVAITQGLSFVPLAEERFDLVLPSALGDDPRVARLLDALVSSGLRRELLALGYDVSATGRAVEEAA